MAANDNVNWQLHYIYVNKKRAGIFFGICRYCGMDIARPNYGTTGLKDHITRRHPAALQLQQAEVPADPPSPLLGVLPVVDEAQRLRVLKKEYPVQAIIDHRWNTAKDGGFKRRGGQPTGRMEYEVVWEKYPDKNTWEPFSHLANAQEKLHEYISINRIQV
ncbi:hypothetical protein AAVH_16597 [Aphelenchoides avenae]|nr:hypothetical protein AAVH_16597 [Aphelenchus avenae]